MSEPSVSQGFRGRHRTMKSAPAISPVTPSKARFGSTNFTQPPVKGVVTPPQSPKSQQQSPTTSAKKRRKSKPKLRDVSSDGHNTHQGYDSPPHFPSNDESNAQTSPTSGVQSTPTKAYAGPNFHSSPAPSSLPVPSWFSKSVPATPTTGKSLQAVLQITEAKLSQSLEEPESHLQMLFRVDKEEKARNCQRGTSPPKLAASINGSPESTPNPSPGVSEVSSLDLFTIGGGKDISTPPQSPYRIHPQVLFPNTSKAKTTQAPAEEVARKRADALKSFLNQPQVSSEKVFETLTSHATGPKTPSKKSLPVQSRYPPSTAPLQTPPKKTTPHPPTSGVQPRATLSPPRHQRGYRPTKSQAPSPAREFASHLPHSYSDRPEIKTDSVLQFTEMQLYLQRVKAMEPRSIASPAVVS